MKSKLSRDDKWFLMNTVLLECMIKEDRTSEQVYIWLHKPSGYYYIRDRFLKGSTGKPKLYFKFDGVDDLRERSYKEQVDFQIKHQGMVKFIGG